MVEPEKRPDYVQKLVFLARDYAKIARNLIHDLDPPARNIDEQEQLHGIDHFLGHWQNFEFQRPNDVIRVEVKNSFEGHVTNRCLETSTVDRILYNLLNNAARFAVEGPLRLDVSPVDGELIRWVISNDISDDQKHWLEERFGEDLKPLFLGGHTRGGQGLGLLNCAEIVMEGFGLGSPKEAVNRGYLGAMVVDQTYHSWFHWPAALPSPNGQKNPG